MSARPVVRILLSCMAWSWLVGVLPVAAIWAATSVSRAFTPSAAASVEATFFIFGVISAYGAVIAFPCGLLGGVIGVALARFKRDPWPCSRWTLAGGVTGAMIPATAQIIMTGGSIMRAWPVFPAVGAIAGTIVAARLARDLEGLSCDLANRR